MRATALRIRLAGLALLLLLLLSSAPAQAVRRALLVGVSELSAQPASLWLQAPRNDVLLMRQTLLTQGFASTDIVVLADGVDGSALPDIANIRAAMAQLLDRSSEGDFVMLYFSGHGARSREQPKRYEEPDGLSENFLARDVQNAYAGQGPLRGSLRDVDLDAWVQAFLARDVFVWSVFDTCAAASLTRGTSTPEVAAETPSDAVRWRGVRADQLARTPTPGQLDELPPSPAAEAVPRARYVAFYASESHQLTPELRLPRKARDARPQGLLTWALAQAMARRPSTWRGLFNGLLAQYPAVIEELELRFPGRDMPSPVAEGALDAALFANTAGALSTLPQWPLQRAGDSLALDAGLLDGLENGLQLHIQALLSDGSVRAGTGRVKKLDLSSATLTLPENLRDMPGNALWNASPMEPPRSARLALSGEGVLPPLPTLALNWPQSLGPGVHAESDVRWIDPGLPTQRLRVISPELEQILGRTDWPVPTAAALRQRLLILAQSKWFTQLTALAQGRRVEGFEVSLEVWRGDRLQRSAPLPLSTPWPGAAAGSRWPCRFATSAGNR